MLLLLAFMKSFTALCQMDYQLKSQERKPLEEPGEESGNSPPFRNTLAVLVFF